MRNASRKRPQLKRSICRLTVNCSAVPLPLSLLLSQTPLLALCFPLSPSQAAASHEQERERERDFFDADVSEADEVVGVGVGVGVGVVVDVGFEVSVRKDCRLSERRLRSTLPRSGSASGAFKWQLTSRQQSRLAAVVDSRPLQHSGEGEL